MMAMLLPRDAGVDVQRCVRMALVHDVAESIVGDITPHCKVRAGAMCERGGSLGPTTRCCRQRRMSTWPSRHTIALRRLAACMTAVAFALALLPWHEQVSPEEKKKLESDAVATIQQMLGPQTEVAREVAELWHEYEEGSTPEGKLVKDLDKLEMIIQVGRGRPACVCVWHHLVQPPDRCCARPPLLRVRPLACCWQAHEYEQAQTGQSLQEFFDSTAGKWRTETG